MFARTKRLMLRPGWPEDAPALACAIGHEQVVGKLARAPWPYALGDAEWFLALPRGGHDARFLIESMEHGAPVLIGGIAIKDVTDGVGEFGYWLTPDAWGRGYATEAGHAVIAIARHALRLRQLHATPFVDNAASARVLAKLGFRATGRTRPLASRARGGETLCALFELDLDDDQGDMPIAA